MFPVSAVLHPACLFVAECLVCRSLLLRPYQASSQRTAPGSFGAALTKLLLTLLLLLCALL